MLSLVLTVVDQQAAIGEAVTRHYFRGERGSNKAASSLVPSAGIDVDDVGVAHHDGVALAELGFKQSGGDVLFRATAREYIVRKNL